MATDKQENGLGRIGEPIARRIAGLPAYLLGALLVAVAPVAIIAFASESPVPNFAYVFGGTLCLVVLFIGWINGDLRSASRETGQALTDVAWERYRFNAADQRALAEFLSADYDERAEVIYLVTSGYSENGAGPASDLRMKRILSSLDQCLAKGASVVRLQIRPDGPLLDSYVGWVCAQMQAHGTRCLVCDVADQVGLPSMAVVRRKDKSGVARQTIEHVGPGPMGGRPARQAVFAWRIDYQPNSRALAALIECLDEFAHRGASLGTPDEYRQFARRLAENHSSCVVKS